MCITEIKQISSSSLVVVDNYTRFHVSIIVSSNVCHIYLYYYDAILTLCLCVKFLCYTKAVVVSKSTGSFSFTLPGIRNI